MMNASSPDRSFAGSIPQIYERYMVPLIFEPYARDIAARVAALRPQRVLEIAAGTGVVTRHLAALLPAATKIVATDLNQPMLDQAAAKGAGRTIDWQQADAMKLPFADESFDAVVCQFGVMFFPDKSVAMSEARRVLRPGGVFLFNVWDRLEANEFAHEVTAALAQLFPEQPPRFMARVPHGYFDHAVIGTDLAKAGFTKSATFETVASVSSAESARFAAIAYCQGTPVRNEIESNMGAHLEEATSVAEAALARRFGPGSIAGRIQAHVISISR